MTRKCRCFIYTCLYEIFSISSLLLLRSSSIHSNILLLYKLRCLVDISCYSIIWFFGNFKNFKNNKKRARTRVKRRDDEESIVSELLLDDLTNVTYFLKRKNYIFWCFFKNQFKMYVIHDLQLFTV